MGEVPPVAVGAIIAALIAAMISLIGLIISKEQKTSEFRQAWIDALQEDLSVYLTQVRGICDGVAVSYPSLEKKVETLTPLYASLNKATFAITLRLNPDEPYAQEMLSAMSSLRDVIGSPTALSPANIQPHEAALLLSAKRLLKSEWRRVKRGEPTFVAAKVGALLLVLAAVVFGGWLVMGTVNLTPASPSSVPTTPRPENGLPTQRATVRDVEPAGVGAPAQQKGH